MRKFALIILGLLLFSSCLKKIDEVETANTNIYDPEYAGDQWWQYTDLYLWTNTNNDQKVRVQVTVTEEYAPQLKPTNIPLTISVNGSSLYETTAAITQNGNYICDLDINPQSTTNYCIDVGVYVEEEDITINVFSECRGL